jgi:hypothetical protein
MENLTTDIDIITQKYTFTGDRVTIDVTSRMGFITGQVTVEQVK